MSRAANGGTVLTVHGIDEVAARIAEMWERYNTERRTALRGFPIYALVLPLPCTSWD